MKVFYQNNMGYFRDTSIDVTLFIINVVWCKNHEGFYLASLDLLKCADRVFWNQ